MKKLFFSLALCLAVLLPGCEKDDPPVLTGTWTMIFSFTGGDSFNGTLTIEQKKDNTLTGNFVFSDNSGFLTLMSTSNISGNQVKIEMMLNTATLSFTGTVNSGYNSLSGNWSSNSIPIGTWLANKKI